MGRTQDLTLTLSLPSDDAHLLLLLLLLNSLKLLLLLLGKPSEQLLTNSLHSSRGNPTSPCMLKSTHVAPCLSSHKARSPLVWGERLMLQLRLALVNWKLLVWIEKSLSLRWNLLPLSHPLSPALALKQIKPQNKHTTQYNRY